MDGKTLGRILTEQINYNSLMETVNYFSTLSRQTGTPDGEAAAEYIIKKLKEKGVHVCSEKPTCYASIPNTATFQMTSPQQKNYYAYTDCFSTEEEISGELYYDVLSEQEGGISLKDEKNRYDNFKDKIILSWDVDEMFFWKAKLAGAKAVIRINFTEADEVMVYGVSRVWGVPTPDTFMFMNVLPVAIIRMNDGLELIEMAKSGQKIEMALTTSAENRLFDYTMPVAYVNGSESENYMLIAAHYDGWFKSVTDNAIGAAMLIELAAVANEMKNELKRGIKFLWLAGHENVPYAGSTWFVDTYFEDLKKHCVAYTNIDVIGNGVEGSQMFANTTRMEGHDFTDDIIEEIQGNRPEHYIPMVHGADQSFWGVQVPLDIMMNCKDPGWWYHTEADTLDKIDMDIAKRDISFYINLAARIVNSEQLPVDMTAFLGEVKYFMNALEDKLDKNFDIIPAIKAVDKVGVKVAELEAELLNHQEKELDSIYMNIAGELARIAYSASDSYDYPLCGDMMAEPVGELGFAAGINSDNTDPDDMLCYTTKFVRMRNRFIGELDKVCDQIDLQMYKLRQ